MDPADQAAGEVIYASDDIPDVPPPERPAEATEFASEGDDSQTAAVIPPHHRLQRLQREWKELQKELELLQDPHPEWLSMMQQLQTELTPATWPERSEWTEATTTTTSSTTQPALTTPPDLLARLSSLEHKCANLPSRLTALEHTEQWTQKAKVLRQDLEAATKAKHKLLSSSSSTDAQTIADLHTQWTQLQGLSDHLPVIVQRLQVLGRSRSETAASALPQLQQQVASLEQTCERLEQAWAVEREQWKKNLEALEEERQGM